MNRTTLVFAATMTLLTSAFAVDIIDQTIVGDDGAPGNDAQHLFMQVGPNTISNSSLTGGSATNTTDSTATEDAYGGAGFWIGMAMGTATANADDSTFVGGDGGEVAISGSLTADVNAYGGSGIKAGSTLLSVTNSSAYGGDGGAVTTDGGAFEVNVDGGNGVQLTVSGQVVLDNVYAEGGDGGSANVTSSANGGAGVLLESSTLDNLIKNSELVGGDGGTASTDDSTANGGAGLELVGVSNVEVVDSTITGGAAGTVNGSAGTAGASISIDGSSLSVSGGELVGDLLFGGTNTSTFTMQDTVFSDAVLISGGIVNVTNTSDEYFQGYDDC